MTTTIFDEARFTAITRRVLADATRVPVIIHIPDAWLTASILGLAAKHPRLNALHKRELRDVQHVLRGAIITRYPQARPLVNDSQQYSENTFVRRAADFMADPDPLTCTLSMRQLWLGVGGLQLAVTHPRCPHPSHVRDIGRQVQAYIVEAHPDAAEVLEQGWTP
jgi:hypothetical protein